MKNGVLIGVSIAAVAGVALYFVMKNKQAGPTIVSATGEGGSSEGGGSYEKPNFTSSTGHQLINPNTGQPIAVLQPGQNIRDVVKRTTARTYTAAESKLLSSIGVNISPTKTTATSTTTPTRTLSSGSGLPVKVAGLFGTHI